MTITFYKNKSEYKKIDKTLEDPLVLTGTLRDMNVSIVNPVIRFALDDSIFDYNYAYITEFGRYYFITNIQVENNGIVVVTFHCDVLSSFKDEIRQNSGYVDNSKNYANFYLNDLNLPVQQNTQITMFKTFASGFSGSSVVLTGLNTSYITNT